MGSHGAVHDLASGFLGAGLADGLIRGPEERCGATAFVAAAGQPGKYGVVGEAAEEGGVLGGGAVPVPVPPERREAPQVAVGRGPEPLSHQLLQMRRLEEQPRLHLQRVGGVVLEESVQPPEVKNNLGGTFPSML